MRTFVLITVLVSTLCATARANLYTYNFTDINQTILDDDDAGLANTRILGGMTGDITDVNVTLNISGGYNGDLYGYLVHESGFAVLLNRVGRTSTDEFGSSGQGFSITLNDNVGANDIHLAPFSAGNELSGTWMTDGRAINPDDVVNTDSRTATLASFNGQNANGSWTLFLADLSPGDESMLMSWGLEISTVPEPTTWALLAFAALVGTVGVGRWVRRLRAADQIPA